mmetsp:Transcript_10424/g.32975  ORF Transcript_10424/g.32975 Transcript_10424/m.32975 type:complete len:206 (+) Transcript_10424:1101-1718(+)
MASCTLERAQPACGWPSPPLARGGTARVRPNWASPSVCSSPRTSTVRPLQSSGTAPISPADSAPDEIHSTPPEAVLEKAGAPDGAQRISRVPPPPPPSACSRSCTGAASSSTAPTESEAGRPRRDRRMVRRTHTLEGLLGGLTLDAYSPPRRARPLSGAPRAAFERGARRHALCAAAQPGLLEASRSGDAAVAPPVPGREWAVLV